MESFNVYEKKKSRASNIKSWRQRTELPKTLIKVVQRREAFNCCVFECS